MTAPKPQHRSGHDDPPAGTRARRGRGALPLDQPTPGRGDATERKGRGGAATRGRGEDRRGAKSPSRSKD